MTTIKPKQSCNLQDIRNSNTLKLRNLVLLDIHCKKSSSISNHCISKESFIKFTCQKGYIFDNLRDEFDSLCRENGEWERIPRCIPSIFFYFIYLFFLNIFLQIKPLNKLGLQLDQQQLNLLDRNRVHYSMFKIKNN